MRTLQPRRIAAECPAERADERRGSAFRDRYVETALPAGGRDLRADESGADHQDPARSRVEEFGEAGRVVIRTQGEYAVQAGFVGIRPGPGPGPGGDQQPVEGELFAVGEDHPLLDRVDPDGTDTELPSRVHLAAARQPDVMRVHPPEQHLLGQRWSVVRRVGFLPHEGQ